MATSVVCLIALVILLSSFDGPTSCDPIDRRRNDYLTRLSGKSRPADQHQQKSRKRNNSVHRPSSSSSAVLTRRSRDDPLLSSLLESGLLSILGRDSRPKRRTSETVVPALMMDLYWERVWRTSQKRGSERMAANRRNSYRPQFHQSSADIIRSFFDTGTGLGNLTEAEEAEERIGREAALYFDVVDISPTEERLQGAELNVHHRCGNASAPAPAPAAGQPGGSARARRLRLTVFQVTRRPPKTRGAAGAAGVFGRRLLDSRVVSDSHCDRTLALDVRPAVVRWTENPAANLGLILRWTATAGTSTTADFLATPPILISYSDRLKPPPPHPQGPPSEEHQQTPSRYSSSSSPRRRHAKRSTGGKRGRSNGLGAQQRDCQRRDLYVDFSDIGWDDWIVAPVGYEAFYCHGECPTFLHDYVNYTNHAVIQAFVHSASPGAAPRPCCVPTELSAIPMLYVDSTGKVILKNYEDMVVEACGCR